MIQDLRDLKEKNRKSIDSSQGRHYCNNCFSTGVNPIELMIYETCFSCAGHGNIDWIDNAMDKRRKDINQKTSKVCRMNNIIQSLIFLKRELRASKISMSLKLKCKNRSSVKTVQELMELIREHEII